MTLDFKRNTCLWFALVLFFCGFSSFSQGDTSGIKAQFALGVNSPSSNGFVKYFNPISEGLGSNSGDLLTITVGASISLSGCYYCGD